MKNFTQNIYKTKLCFVVKQKNTSCSVNVQKRKQNWEEVTYYGKKEKGSKEERHQEEGYKEAPIVLVILSSESKGSGVIPELLLLAGGLSGFPGTDHQTVRLTEVLENTRLGDSK